MPSVWINHEACVLEASFNLFLCLSLSAYVSHFSLWCSFSLSPLCSISIFLLLCPFFHDLLYLYLFLPSLLFTISPLWHQVSSLPPREIYHPDLSVIELRTLRTSALRFNLFWPEQGACAPSSYHYIRENGMAPSQQKRQIRSWT